MAVKNELDARLQHAVERTDSQGGVTVTYPASAPLKGEIVFTKDSNNKIDNFKVGDGDTYYANLPKFLPEWTRNTNKPTYTASEVGALPDSTTFVSSFNGDTGAVTYAAPVTSVNNQTGDVTISTGENNIIEAITFNGNTAPITNKTAEITGKVISSVTKDTSVIPNVTTITYSDGSTTTIVDGKDGTSFNIKGTVTSPNNLPSTGQTLGDGYIISGSSTASENGHLWVYTGTGTVHGFTDCGNIQGPQGPQGIQGNTGIGIASIAKTATSGLVDTYTITYTDSTTTTYTVTNGADGQDGQDGTDGITPHIDSSTNHWMLGSTDTGVNATGPQGTQGVQGEQGVGIGSVVPPSTTGQTTDVYTIMSDEQTPSQLGTFTVYNGEDGAAGADGSTWFSGSTDPQNVIGAKAGDFYLNTTSYNVFKATASGSSISWGSAICNIKGSQGNPGQNGQNGDSVYIAYANDDQGTDFNYDSPYSGEKYIGTYIGDGSGVDDYTKYQWYKFIGDDGQDLTVKPYYNVASNATPKTLQGHLSDVGNLSSKNGIYIPANTLLTDNSTQIVQSDYLGCFIPNTALSTMSLGQSFEIVIKGQLPIRPGTSSNYSTLFYMINLNNINSGTWFTSGNYMCLDRTANLSYYITNVLRIVRINTDLYSVIFLIGDPDS